MSGQNATEKRKLEKSDHLDGEGVIMKFNDSMSFSSVISSNHPNHLEAETLTLSLSRKSENVIRETIRCLR
jgi:hypothetical protein